MSQLNWKFNRGSLRGSLASLRTNKGLAGKGSYTQWMQLNVGRLDAKRARFHFHFIVRTHFSGFSVSVVCECTLFLSRPLGAKQDLFALPCFVTFKYLSVLFFTFGGARHPLFFSAVSTFFLHCALPFGWCLCCVAAAEPLV